MQKRPRARQAEERSSRLCGCRSRDSWSPWPVLSWLFTPRSSTRRNLAKSQWARSNRVLSSASWLCLSLSRMASTPALLNLLLQRPGSEAQTDETLLEQLVRSVEAAPLELVVDRKPVQVTPPRALVESLLGPLAIWLHDMQLQQPPGGRRLRVGVIGAAGAGKSFLCAILAAICDRLWGGGWAVLSMDGYHFPNAYLEASTYTDPSTGAVHSLKAMKGILESIDGASLASDLARLADRSLTIDDLPVYDRHTHQPVRGLLRVEPSHGLVLVEGLHLLDREGVWSDVCGRLDTTIFLDLPKDLCKARVVDRKVANGRAREAVEEHYWRVDSPICDRLQGHKGRADVVVGLGEGGGKEGTSTVVTRVGLSGRLWAHAPCSSRQGQAVGQLLLALGVNPAVQRTITLDGVLRVGDVNRAAMAASMGIGGKGQNFSKAAARACEWWSSTGGQVEVAVAQFEGGETGRDLSRLLSERGIRVIAQPVAAPTRVCSTLLSRGEAGEAVITELVEPGGKVPTEAVEGLLSQLAGIRETDRALRGLAVMGSLPPGVGTDFYARAAGLLCGGTEGGVESPLLLVDTVVGLSQLLSASSSMPIALLKLNASELVAVTRAWLPHDDGSGPALQACALALLDRHPHVYAVAVTAGPDEAHLWRRWEGVAEAPPPQQRGAVLHVTYAIPPLAPQALVNPIGAGDTCGAVALSWLLLASSSSTPQSRGRPAVERAFAWGLAAATASCLRVEPADFDMEGAAMVAANLRILSEVVGRY